MTKTFSVGLAEMIDGVKRLNEGNKLNFTPLKDLIVVKRDAPKAEILGFVIPESAQEKPTQGEVLSIGSKVKDVKVGDRVIFGKFDGIEQTIENQKILILSESLIWGVLSDDS